MIDALLILGVVVVLTIVLLLVIAWGVHQYDRYLKRRDEKEDR